MKEIEVSKSTNTKPFGLVIYARSGLGKTTFLGEFVKQAKNGILFQCGEDGLSDLDPKWTDGIPHFPHVLGDYYELNDGENDSDWSDMQRAARGWTWFKNDLLHYLMTGKHEFTHVAFDNIDNLINRNLDAYVTLTYYKGNANTANAYGGSKLKEMYSELAFVIKAFEYLQKRGISVFVGSHAQSTNFKDPANPDYKKWSLAIPAREDYNLRTLLINWSSATVFGTIDIEVENKKVSGSRHILMTKDSSAYEAKCRYAISEQIEFDYNCFKNEIIKSSKKESK